MGIEIKITAVDANELRVHLFALGQMAVGSAVEYVNAAGEPVSTPAPEVEEPKKRTRKAKVDTASAKEQVAEAAAEDEAYNRSEGEAEPVAQAETEEKLEDLQQKVRVLCAELTGSMGVPSAKIVETLKEIGGEKIGMLDATQCRAFIGKLEKIKASATA